MNQELESFKALTPVAPKPGVQRPMLLRGKAAKRIKAEKSAVLCKSEIDANLLAFQLMKNAMAEEAKSAGEDYLLYESGDDSLDEMDDEVLSLGGQSESEEEEGDLVHLAYNFAKGAIGQGVDIDFAKAIHDASEEIATCKDFVDISELSEAEDVEDLRMNEAAASGREGAAGGEELELEDAAAQDLEGLDLLRQKAKQTLLSAAGDGSLVVALKAAVGAQVEAMQVESLRLEARNAMLKAAGNGRLAQALKQMRKALPELAVHTEEPQDDAEVSVSEVFNAKAAPKPPGQEDFAQGTARALKLAWCMAGSPARSLRQKDVRKALQGERFCRPSLQAYPFVEHVQAEDKRDSEPIGAPGRSADHLAGQPRLTGSASAISLGLSRAKVGLRCVNSRCSSVGSLRPLKVKGPVLPPALPPTAFLHKHEPAAKQGM